ncbi:MAG: hypothetical protein HZA04_09520 [Nitrospinae bacterium]|nr:hypothetical protein [Nitrospinota bacterium]
MNGLLLIWRYLTSGVCLALVVLAAFSAPADAEISLNLGRENFTWSEYSGGTRLLEENGPRYFFSFGYLQDGDEGALFGYRGKVYGGEVGYDGQTQSGVPVSTTTGYSGMLNEFELRYRLPGGVFKGSYSLDAVAGFGLDFWRREIKGTYVAAVNEFAAGYVEEYLIGFARLGLELRRGGHGIQMGAGVKLPVYTWEKANLQTALGTNTDPVLEPGKNMSYYASLGYRFASPFIAQVTYEGYRFPESPKVPVTINGVAARVYQPESRMDIVVFSVGYIFGTNGKGEAAPAQ